MAEGVAFPDNYVAHFYSKGAAGVRRPVQII